MFARLDRSVVRRLCVACAVAVVIAAVGVTAAVPARDAGSAPLLVGRPWLAVPEMYECNEVPFAPAALTGPPPASSRAERAALSRALASPEVRFERWPPRGWRVLGRTSAKVLFALPSRDLPVIRLERGALKLAGYGLCEPRRAARRLEVEDVEIPAFRGRARTVRLQVAMRRCGPQDTDKRLRARLRRVEAERVGRTRLRLLVLARPAPRRPGVVCEASRRTLEVVVRFRAPVAHRQLESGAFL